MTITTGTTAALAQGDKVRILDGAHRAGYEGTTSQHVGEVVTVVSGPDSDGDFYVRLENGRCIFLLPQFLQKVIDPAPVSETVERFEVGQKYEVTRDNISGGFTRGDVLTAVSLNGSDARTALLTKKDTSVEPSPEWENGVTAYVSVDHVKPYLAEWERELLAMTPAPAPVDDAALREAREEAERAEKALADFKARVRLDLISESYRQGDAWIESIDSWLDELGLPDQYDGMPTTMRTVVLLKGNRVATLMERGESRPWEVKQLSDEGARYVRFFSYQEIKDQFVTVLVEGPDEDDDFRE